MTPVIPGTVYRSRAQATQFFLERGVAMGRTTLADMAANAKGPRYAVINGRALYTEYELAAWLSEQAELPPHASRRGRSRSSEVA